ncbi:hypothetical protein Tco_0623305 [Tanacetum coccineum]
MVEASVDHVDIADLLEDSGSLLSYTHSMSLGPLSIPSMGSLIIICLISVCVLVPLPEQTGQQTGDET